MVTDPLLSEFVKDEDLIRRLRHCTQLPSPPGVAARIIELGQDPEATLADVVDAVSVDPALSLKLVRLANAPIYARRRKTENIRQAIMMFGLNGTITVALSFSLVGNLQADDDTGMDYSIFWQRSLAMASCTRVFGGKLGLGPKEDLFLAGLLQDIGMLALDKAVPDIYDGLGEKQREHEAIVATELEKVHVDHASVGAWLLNNWNLPERLVIAAAGSHDPQVTAEYPQYDSFVKCIALASRATGIFVEKDTAAATQRAAKAAEEFFDMDADAFSETLDEVRSDLQESASIFEIDMGNAEIMTSLLEEAKEILTIRNLTTMQEAAELQKATANLESKTRELEEATRRDGLTGLYNRAHFDEALEEEFVPAQRHGWPLSLAFVDLDHFKSINDTYGHQAGDQVLRNAAKLLMQGTRDSDLVCRYGGEEFVVILPGTPLDGAKITAERLVRLFQETTHKVSDTEAPIPVTVSLGLATLNDGNSFADAKSFLDAADQAVYRAKRNGRNQFVIHHPAAPPVSAPNISVTDVVKS